MHNELAARLRPATPIVEITDLILFFFFEKKLHFGLVQRNGESSGGKALRRLSPKRRLLKALEARGEAYFELNANERQRRAARVGRLQGELAHAQCVAFTLAMLTVER